MFTIWMLKGNIKIIEVISSLFRVGKYNSEFNLFMGRLGNLFLAI